MQHTAIVTSIEQQTPSVKSFVLDCGSENFSFFAGQWVDIHRTIDDETHNCGYSITSTPTNRNTIEFAAKLAPNLLLTKYLHDECKVGDKLYISKAKGNIWINQNIEGPYVFIGGGVGITPLYSMISQILQIKPNTPIVLLYSITHVEEYLFRNEIKQLQENNANFHCYITVTRGENQGMGFSGRVSEEILKAVKLPENASYYLCGPPSMVDSVADLLTQLKDELHLTPEKIYYDRWWA